MKNYNKLNHIQSFNTKDTKMKKLTILIALLVVVGFSTNAFAGSSATASATATIVNPISIAKTADMNFGNVATDGTVGTVILAAAGTRTKTGGVTLPATVGTVTAATFTVTGVSGYTYAVTLPVAATVVSSGANNMNVDTWTSDAGGTITGGTVTLHVGATLNLVATQVAGVYVSATPFTVTVNYN
jgi:hypothetical protein